MSDYFIKHFYDQVKDPSWPEIKNYNEFLMLPDAIKEECNTIHNFPKRLNMLEEVSYWRMQQTHNVGYQYNNIVYIPIYKCAHSYYTKFFRDALGWQQVNLHELNFDEVITFGLLMNPMTRRVKGFTQVLCMAYNDDYKTVLDLLQSPGFATFVSKITLLDGHTIPYTIAFGDLLHKIHWIPMELFTDIGLKQEITRFLNNNNVKVEIPNDRRINQSSLEKENIFNTIQDIILRLEPPGELGLLFANDVKFYNNLLEHYANSHNYN